LLLQAERLRLHFSTGLLTTAVTGAFQGRVENDKTHFKILTYASLLILNDIHLNATTEDVLLLLKLQKITAEFLCFGFWSDSESGNFPTLGVFRLRRGPL